MGRYYSEAAKNPDERCFFCVRPVRDHCYWLRQPPSWCRGFATKPICDYCTGTIFSARIQHHPHEENKRAMRISKKQAHDHMLEMQIVAGILEKAVYALKKEIRKQRALV